MCVEMTDEISVFLWNPHHNSFQNSLNKRWTNTLWIVLTNYYRNQ